MTDQQPLRIFQQLQANGFRDLTGSRVSAAIPVSETLINQIILETMPPNLPVRQVLIGVEAGNRLAVRVTPRLGLLPAMTIKLDIERQPELPDSPVLVLRMATLPGLFGLAGAALPIAQMLPPGVRLQGELILVDLRAMAEQRGFGDLFQFLRSVRISTESGRILLHLEAGVG